MMIKRPVLRLPFTSLVVDWLLLSWKCFLSQFHSPFCPKFFFSFLIWLKCFIPCLYGSSTFNQYLGLDQKIFLRVYFISICCHHGLSCLNNFCRFLLYPKTDWWNTLQKWYHCERFYCKCRQPSLYFCCWRYNSSLRCYGILLLVSILFVLSYETWYRSTDTVAIFMKTETLNIYH